MNKQIIVLVVFTVAAVSGSWFLLKSEELAIPKSNVLFEDIKGHAQAIDKIILRNNLGNIITAEQMHMEGNGSHFPIDVAEVKTQRWYVTNVNDSGKGYPADQVKLSELLGALVKAELVEAKTKQVSKYERLGLKGIEEGDSQAVEVSVYAGSRQWNVLIGKDASNGKGTYVRKPVEQQTWLSDQKFDIGESQGDWLNHTLFSFSADNVRSIQRTDEEQWKIEKVDAGEADFQLVDRQDSELKYDSVLETLAKDISSIEFDKLHVMDDELWDSLSALVSLELETFVGDRYSLALAEGNDKIFLQITSDTSSDFWASWLFEVSSYTKTQLSKRLTDFIINQNESLNASEGN
ncbi:DUF4340 domain-containing protein [Alteromonadaceae bacterium M269]|nr:DUF4340 domain-containing protein [Alteromonadaceae bacterium M269]